MDILDQRKTTVSVTDQSDARVIELRIGERRQGESQFALFSANQARTVAYALLAGAVALDEKKSN